MSEQLSRAVARVIGRLLAERGLSGNQLAKTAGLEQTSVARKLRGASSFSLDDLAAVCPVLGVKVADVLELAEAGDVTPTGD
jgi:transcriptional regulator with XRE-family HTH domain